MRDIVYWVWLAQKNGAGRADAVKLLKHFPGGAREIYEAPYERIAAVKECSEEFIQRLTNHDLAPAERILEFCFMNGIRIISCASPNYPRRLQDLYNKPIVIYARGMIEDLDSRFCVSIVGTRKMSNYGKHITFMLARQLIAYGAIIISGAAYGIDSAANSTAVFFEEPTVAVLGSGVNVPYPQQNKELLDWIGTHGMVISEFEPNTPPYGRNFPIRNRIISGLADAVVVVEGDGKSGALITARHAADQGRAVYAVPGNIGAVNSVGPLRMIRDGAKAVTCTEDIIEDFADRFNLVKIDRIAKSDKYLRYEYNRTLPVHSENEPISTEKQDKMAGLSVPAINKPRGAYPLPDIPTPENCGYSAADKRKLPKKGASDKNAYNPSKRGKITENTASVSRKVPQEFKESAVTEENNARAELEFVMNKLSDVQRKIYEAFPEKEIVNTDKLVQLGFGAAEVLASLTFLEVNSLVESLPGGLYRKKI